MRHLFVGILACLVWTFSVVADSQLVVSAAASLTDPLTVIVQRYKLAHPGEITLSFGASGTLMAQIRRGAEVDLFIAAADEPVQELIDAGLADAGSRIVVAGNSLVLVVPAKAQASGSWDLLKDAAVRRVAIGDPSNVPAGMYAMQTLTAMGIADGVKSKLVYGENVRQVLLYVQRGEVDAGVVYRSDAVAAGKTVRVVATAPESTHGAIEYPAVVLKRSTQREAARQFLGYVMSSGGQAVFASSGFGAASDLLSSTEGAPHPSPLSGSTAITAGNYGERGQMLVQAVRLSLEIAVAATVAAVIVGVMLAYWMSRRKFAGRSVLEALICLPLILPPTVVGYLLIVMLGADSFVGRWLHYSIVFRIEGAILAAAVVALPLVYIPTRAAFSGVERELEDIARLMGANAVQTFWYLTLPMARRGIAGGFVLGFARALGEFGATMMVFGMQPGKMTLPISIYTDFESMNMRHAWPAVAILIGISVGVMVGYGFLVRGGEARGK
jgi:molybdenum ABC transporter molybdate-binding protein/molybdate ABC transporter permease protein